MHCMKKIHIISLFCAALLTLATGCEKSPAPGTDGVNNGYPYVDLGLSVKWATCNVGATSPTQSGAFFAWGETSAQTDGAYTKESYSFKENPTGLSGNNDAATVRMGGTWRTPDKENWLELYRECTWTWVESYNGVLCNGYVVVSNKEGYKDRHIFLPAAGKRENSKASWIGSNGIYWASPIYYPYEKKMAYVFIINKSGYGWNQEERDLGLSVRGVFE